MKQVWFGVGSVVVNVAVWAALAVGTDHKAPPPTDTEIVVERVELDTSGRPKPKIIEPKKIKENIRRAAKTPPASAPHKEPVPDPGHSHLLTSKPAPGPQPTSEPVVPDGGNAKPGTAVIQQPGTGSGQTPVAPPAPTPPAPDPKPTPPPTPPVPDPKPTPPPVAPPVKPDPTPPPAPPPVKPKGITRDAEAIEKVNPTIPEELLTQSFRRSVRVRVRIARDGSFTVELRASSGNEKVDRLALDALRQWKWRPKLVDGEPTEDLQTFRFEFEVH